MISLSLPLTWLLEGNQVLISLCNWVSVDWFWIDDQIYWTRGYGTSVRFTVHCLTCTHPLVSTVTSSLSLLGSSFQQWMFPFLLVPRLSSASGTSFSQQQLTMIKLQESCNSLNHQPTPTLLAISHQPLLFSLLSQDSHNCCCCCSLYSLSMDHIENPSQQFCCCYHAYCVEYTASQLLCWFVIQICFLAMGVFAEPFPRYDNLCWPHSSCLMQICHNINQADARTGLDDGERVIDKMAGYNSTWEVDYIGWSAVYIFLNYSVKLNNSSVSLLGKLQQINVELLALPVHPHRLRLL
jgi:hypothetical protein